MNTLKKLCSHDGIFAARCEYQGAPVAYSVSDSSMTLPGDAHEYPGDEEIQLLEAVLKLAKLVGDDITHYRAIFPNQRAVLVARSPEHEQCWIAVLYSTSAPVVKSLKRLVLRQFKNFTPHQIRGGDEPVSMSLP